MQPASSASLEAQWPDLVAAVSAAIDLQATARTSEALVRRREIRSAEALLRLALAYGPGGLSLRTAAAWAGVSGLADLSDTAVMNRLRKAADWLGEIAGALLRRAAAAPPTPGPLPGRRLRIADGSMITGPGGKPKWRLHATYDPVAARFTGLGLTDERGAESFDRTAWRPGEPSRWTTPARAAGRAARPCSRRASSSSASRRRRRRGPPRRSTGARTGAARTGRRSRSPCGRP